MYNGHADVTALMRPDGTIAATYYYDSFGNITDTTGYAGNSITYAGYQYDYSNRPGSLTYSNVRTTYQPWTTKVIYYNGDHFAKVIAYDSSGYSSKLYSKWGGAELIKSTNKDCFASGIYGSAYYYID